jgi:hypothetical protein
MEKNLMAPFQVFCEYLALKSHFSNPKYDYFKYNKKVRATVTSFNRRKDKYFFERTSRKLSDKEIVDFLVSNFVSADNPQNLWIGAIINSGERTYQEWMRRQQSLTYLFKEQSNELLSETKLEDVFNCSKGHPIILKKFLSGQLSLETLVIYEKIFGFSKTFDKKLLDPVWETVSLKIKKYAPFINTDIFQFKRILRDILNE